MRIKILHLFFKLSIIMSFVILFSGPALAERKNGFDLSNALVPSKKILRGGPPKGGIPAIDKPRFVSAENANFLSPKDRVLGIWLDNTAKAYPIKILNWHEIVNDSIGDKPFMITYCPLCGTGIAFSSKINGGSIRFGVSGLLYNSDVLLYDRKTESLWSQIMQQAISGFYKGKKLDAIPLNHTTWKKWKETYPATLVLSVNTGFERDYGRNPYHAYNTSKQLYFPVSHTAPDTFHPKERVLGLKVGETVKAYPFVELNKNGKKEVIDKIDKTTYTIHWDIKNQSGKIFDYQKNEVPVVQAFWFAWYAFYPKTFVFRASK